MGGASSKGEGSIQSSKMEVFGLESHKENIKEYLIHGDPESLGIKISGESKSRNTTLAICGESGSGKTTLARCVYDDIDVSHHFHKRAWFTVGTICKARDILESLYYSLTSASKTMEDIKMMSGPTLTNEVSKELARDKPWLIVLDDVCSSNDIWGQGLHSVIPHEKKRSRIIITTRSLEGVEGYNPKIEYKMPSLEKEEQWKLFKRRSELQDEALKKIGRNIIDTLDGLPLAILLVAHRLRSDKSREFWESCGRQMERSKSGKSLHRAVALSHNKLPEHLQQCLLYLRRFPTDKVISAEKLCLLWMAEGMIQPESLEDARKCYKELRDSRLVIEEERGDVSASSQCFALCKAIPSQRFELCNDVPPRPPPRKYSKRVRFNISGAKQIGQTLFFDGTSSKKRTADSSKHSDEFSALDYNGVNFAEGKFLEGVEKLQGLKYLSFQGCSLTELPKLISKIASLETLDLRAEDSCCMCIPDVLSELSQLRHLYFPRAFKTEKDKLKLHGLGHLEILENFHAGKCKSADLESLEKLRSLTCIEVKMIEDLKNILKAIEMNKYFHTSLVVKKIDAYSTEYKGTVQKMFACHHIQILHIQGCHVGEFPTGFQFGSNFTEMVLDETTFQDDRLLLRKKHPSLKSLVLRNNALSEAKKMVFQDEYFPELTSLKLENLKSLKEFEVNKAVPLAVLTISKCGKLKELPVHELAEMETLKKLITPGSYEDQVKKINDERKNGKKHIALATAK